MANNAARVSLGLVIQLRMQRTSRCTWPSSNTCVMATGPPQPGSLCSSHHRGDNPGGLVIEPGRRGDGVRIPGKRGPLKCALPEDGRGKVSWGRGLRGSAELVPSPWRGPLGHQVTTPTANQIVSRFWSLGVCFSPAFAQG